MPDFDYIKTKREDVQEISASSYKYVKPVMRWYTKANVWVFKASKGRLWKHFPGGFPICVLGCKGAKSGQLREVALIHLPYKDKELLVASQGGMQPHPAWYYNVSANPEVTITVAGGSKDYIARQVDDDEKRDLWPHLLSLYPDFDEYQARTDRNIAVFMCDLAS